MQRDFNDVERLAVAQTFFKLAGELVDTKNPDSLRSAVDRGYKELYERTGSKSFDVMLDGQQVGTYSLKFSKPKPEETRQVFEVTDYEKLARWFDGLDAGTIADFAADNLAQFAEWALNKTGELADGCELTPVVTPATDKQYIGGTLKVDAESVMNAMGELLPPGIAGLLGGGDE